jgi:dihydrofolate reductase
MSIHGNHVTASISVSLDGLVTGPDDGPGCGLGVGGERLHYWVMGGPWTYEGEHDTDGMTGADREYFEALTDGLGAGIVGRGMYDAAGRWGETNPFPGPLIVLTHRLEDALPETSGFHYSDDFDEAVAKASRLAGDGVIAFGGGADVIRQALRAGIVDTLGISTAPVILGAGKRLFEGGEPDLDLDVRATYSSPYATHVIYDVRRSS